MNRAYKYLRPDISTSLSDITGVFLLLIITFVHPTIAFKAFRLAFALTDRFQWPQVTHGGQSRILDDGHLASYPLEGLQAREARELGAEGNDEVPKYLLDKLEAGTAKGVKKGVKDKRP